MEKDSLEAKLKFIVLGTTDIAINYSRGIRESGGEVLALFSLKKELLPLNSLDISEFAAKNNISYHELDDINSKDSLALMKSYNPEYAFVSWPKLLEKQALMVPNEFCIGTHPTDLPYNRGRHPLHWLINLGISDSKVSFFKIDEGVDTGSILLKVPFSIDKKDTINEVFLKMNESIYNGTKTICEKIKQGNLEKIKQEGLPNYWRKRNPHDSLIDLRMPYDLISRLVRSYSPPYPCASLVFENNIFPISNVSTFNSGLSNEELKRLEPGRIISIENKRIRVKVDDVIADLESTVKIPEDLKDKKYIFPPSKYLSKYSIEI
ncbi:Methionyl-tRNA formyltransferase [uncultured archaeon]|nr:Methionyl-tRNA formyltransferase [uncultured archaeon]